MKMFDGKFHASLLEEEIKQIISTEPQKPRTLSIIQVGQDPASLKYVKLKIDLCYKFGIPANFTNIPETENLENIEEKVKQIAKDEKVGGVIIQLPLPKNIQKPLLNLIPIEKDIDLLSDFSQNKYYNSNFDKLPPVVRALQYFMNFAGIDPLNLDCTIIGKGFLVGSPIGHFLWAAGSNITYLDENDPLEEMSLKTDLVICAAGVPSLLKGQQLKSGTHVVDYGSSVVNGKVVGDFDTTSKTAHLGVISPSPGGIGPLVVRYILLNHLESQID